MRYPHGGSRFRNMPEMGLSLKRSEEIPRSGGVTPKEVQEELKNVDITLKIGHARMAKNGLEGDCMTPEVPTMCFTGRVKARMAKSVDKAITRQVIRRWYNLNPDMEGERDP